MEKQNKSTQEQARNKRWLQVLEFGVEDVLRKKENQLQQISHSLFVVLP